MFSGKVNADSIHKPDGRWSHSTFTGKMLSGVYLRPELLEAADKVYRKATEHGIDGHSAALRWTLWHSEVKKEHGDAIIVAASSIEQLDANLKACDDGPLPEELVQVFEDVWPLAEPVAPWAWIDIKGTEIEKGIEEMNKQSKDST